MDREEAKKYLPIIKAFADGKKIETRYDIYDWTETDVLHIESNNEYRIKQEPKYRPFKTAEECWNEARNHNDFPWIRYIGGGFTQIKSIGKNDVTVESIREHPYSTHSFAMAYHTLTFIDGTPFGIKEE